MSRPTILLVVQSAMAAKLLPWLRAENYELVVLDDFPRAKIFLDLRPAALVTELRLREYNGLHLALRAQQAGVPVVIVGDPDMVVERDAASMGAVYIRTPELGRESIVATLSRMRQSALSPMPTSNLAWIDRSECQALRPRSATALITKDCSQC
jgi:hypothetical protein